MESYPKCSPNPPPIPSDRMSTAPNSPVAMRNRTPTAHGGAGGTSAIRTHSRLFHNGNAEPKLIMYLSLFRFFLCTHSRCGNPLGDRSFLRSPYEVVYIPPDPIRCCRSVSSAQTC